MNLKSNLSLNKTIVTKTTTRKKNKNVDKRDSAWTFFGKADAGSNNHNGDNININQSQPILVPVADVRDQAESYFNKRMGTLGYDCTREYDKAYNEFLKSWLDWAESNFDEVLPSNSETYKKFKEMEDTYMKGVSYTGKK